MAWELCRATASYRANFPELYVLTDTMRQTHIHQTKTCFALM